MQGSLFDVEPEKKDAKPARRKRGAAPPQVAGVLPDAPRIAAQKGQEQAESNANEEWLEVAYAALSAVAREKPELTTDDIWAKLEEWGEAGKTIPQTPTNSAIGPVVVRAKKQGLLAFAGRMEPSKRTERHMNHLRVWRSLTYAEGGLC